MWPLKQVGNGVAGQLSEDATRCDRVLEDQQRRREGPKAGGDVEC